MVWVGNNGRDTFYVDRPGKFNKRKRSSNYNSGQSSPSISLWPPLSYEEKNLDPIERTVRGRLVWKKEWWTGVHQKKRCRTIRRWKRSKVKFVITVLSVLGVLCTPDARSFPWRQGYAISPIEKVTTRIQGPTCVIYMVDDLFRFDGVGFSC